MGPSQVRRASKSGMRTRSRFARQLTGRQGLRLPDHGAFVVERQRTAISSNLEGLTDCYAGTTRKSAQDHRAGGDLRKQSFVPVLPRTAAPWYGRELVVPAMSGSRSKGKAAAQRRHGGCAMPGTKREV